MKMIDVFDLMAKGEINEGQTLTIDDNLYELDDEGIFRRKNFVNHIAAPELTHDYYPNREFLNAEVTLGDEEE